MHHATRTLKLPEIWRVACHTENVGPGTTFVAVHGQTVDGALYIQEAINKGASRIVVSRDTSVSPELADVLAAKNIDLMRVENTRLALAELSAKAYNFPAQKLRIIGITGTKGKTTTATLLYHMLCSSGKKVALISTVENKIQDVIFKAPLTTPQPDYVHMFFDMCVQEGVEYIIMEVAAQAFSLHRVHGIYFDAGIFTNFSHEHLEFYPSMAEYFAAKCLLREHMKPQAPIVINADNTTLQAFEYDHSMPISLKDVSIISVAPIVCTAMIDEQLYTINAPFLPGEFNIYNILCAMHCAQYFGLSKEEMAQALAHFSGIKGRLQKHLLPSGATCYIDYAHNPDSYTQVLSLLRSMTDYLIVVFGCAGLRDHTRRPIMGQIAASYADIAVLTADNPRTEDQAAIVAEIKQGIAQTDMYKVVEIADRAEAIEYACKQAVKDAIVVILGKGPDEYQIIGTTKHYFSDTQTVMRFVREC